MTANARLLSGLVVCLSSVALSQQFASEPGGLYIRSYDGAYVAAAVRQPPGPGPFPAILFIHGGVGGAGLESMKNFTRNKVPDHFFRLGFAVMSADYRRFHFGEDEIQDVLAAYRQLESYPFVDKSRISIIGGSHGGYLAEMLATRIRPAAVVSFAGLTDIEGMFFDQAQAFRASFKGWSDWRWRLLSNSASRGERARQADLGRRAAPAQPRQAVPRREEPGSAGFEVALDLAWRCGDRRELYRIISPKDNADQIASPLLYVAGSEDDLRFAGQALVKTLRTRGMTAEYSEHPGMAHGFYWGQTPEPPQEFYRALKIATDFVQRHGGSKK